MFAVVNGGMAEDKYRDQIMSYASGSPRSLQHFAYRDPSDFGHDFLDVSQLRQVVRDAQGA